MPSAFTVTFRAGGPIEPSFDDLHRLACWMFEGADSGSRHDQDKPFTVWPVLPSRTTAGMLDLRLNWLPDDDEEIEAAGRTRVGQGPRLGEHRLDVMDLTVERARLGHLRGLGPLWDCEFAFLSPTYFSRSGRDYLLPDPELIARKLVDRWNATSSGSEALMVDPATARALGCRILMKAHQWSTRRLVSSGGRRTGFVGQVRLGLGRRDPTDGEAVAAARLFASLCAFVPFCGLGGVSMNQLPLATLPRPGHAP